MSSEMLRVDNLRQRLFCNSVLDTKRESRCPVCNAMFSTTYSMRLHLQTVHMDLKPQNLSAKTFYREFNNNNSLSNNNNNNCSSNNNNNNNMAAKSPGKMTMTFNDCSPERSALQHVTPVKSSYNGDSTCSTDFSDGYPSDKDSYFGGSPKDDIPLSVSGVAAGGGFASHSSPANNNHKRSSSGHVKAKRTYACRLCSTVFGNLRALKGHNSSSHNKSTNGMYACNICEFASTEKASLNHHMKGHTGETPYVCKKCSYAFTTKANCERHLRTIHKASNAEVKASILFKNEDKPSGSSIHSANDETTVSASADKTQELYHHLRLPYHCTNQQTTAHDYYESSVQKSCSEDDEEDEDDEPLDLSMKRFKQDFDCEPQDLSINSNKQSSFATAEHTDDEDVKPMAATVAFPEQFVPHAPPGFMDLSIPTPLHAYFLNEHRMFFNGMYPAADRMLPIPLTVDMIRAMRQMNEPAQGIAALREPADPVVPPKPDTPEPVEAAVPHLPPVPPSTEVTQKSKDANGLRLVMKNGILVPKQRRFRTDRPHVCETCKRAFTLKSNRDRHVKNQHPTDWHKKPRSLSSKSEPQFSAVKQEQQDTTSSPISDQVKMALSLKCRPSSEQLHRTEDEVDEEDEDDDDVVEEDKLVIVEDGGENSKPVGVKEECAEVKEESADLVSISRLLDNASHQTFPQFNRSDEDHNEVTSSEEEHSEAASYSENDGSSINAVNNNIDINFNTDKDDNREKRKKVSAYAAAPNRVLCPFCYLSFPWTSSLKRHIRTHTGEKPYQCKHCPLSFSTKSNRDRHILRLHCTPPGKSAASSDNETTVAVTDAKHAAYKCTSCPNATFSKRKNLISHINRVHFDKSGGGGAGEDDERVGDDGTAEDDGAESERGDYSSTMAVFNGWCGNNAATAAAAATTITTTTTANTTTTTATAAAAANPSNTVSGSEPCFKCHLCDSSYLDRQGALDHIRIDHAECYEILVSQGAMDNDHDSSAVKQDDVENRKVLCAFCLHRFYSAEDLRRHMRTHTKEQPFACLSCKRRFTLKHSMVRHIAKKHGGCQDHERRSVSPPSTPPTRDQVTGYLDDCCDGSRTDTSLIGTLLGIRDSTVIDQVLQTKSPEDAAKMLGIKSGSSNSSCD